MNRDDRSDYWYRRTGRLIVNKVTRAVGLDWREDEDGKKHFSRRIVFTPPPAPLPDPIPVPTPQPPPMSDQTVPLTGRFGVVRHDYEIHGMSRPELLERELGYPLVNKNGVRIEGLPETTKAIDSSMIKLYSQWQWFWFNLLWKANPDMSKDEAVNEFRKITRSNAFKTNGTGAESGYANYVTGQNLDGEPMKTEIIWTGGAYLEIVGETVGAYKVRMLNALRQPPDLSVFDGIHQTPFIYFATTSNRANEGTLVIPLTGGATIPVPSIAKADFALIDKTRVRILEPGSVVPSPYNQ